MSAIEIIGKRHSYRDKCFAIQDYSAAIENMLLAIGIAEENIVFPKKKAFEERACFNSFSIKE